MQQPLRKCDRRTLLLTGGAAVVGAAASAAPAAGHPGHGTEHEPDAALFAAEFGTTVSAQEYDVAPVGRSGPLAFTRVVLDRGVRPRRVYARREMVAVVLPPGGGALDTDQLAASGPVRAVGMVPLVFGTKPPDPRTRPRVT